MFGISLHYCIYYRIRMLLMLSKCLLNFTTATTHIGGLPCNIGQSTEPRFAVHRWFISGSMRSTSKRIRETNSNADSSNIHIYICYNLHNAMWLKKTFTQILRKKRWIKQHSYLTRVAPSLSEYSLPTSGEKIKQLENSCSIST